MKNELLLEIGTEEIPALYLEESCTRFKDILSRELSNNNLEFDKVETYYTPRRIVVRVVNLLPLQKDTIIEVIGPPKNIAYDDEGKPTAAATGFAKAQGVEVNDLRVVKKQRGEFVVAVKHIKGKHTKEILKEILPKSITSIPFKKSMRWGFSKITFARPIRWILCIYNSEAVEFQIEDIISSSTTTGHRFVANTKFEPKSWAEYKEELSKKFVIVEQEKRREKIVRETESILADLNASALLDEELLTIVTNLVEYPIVLKGTFEERFLRLPKEVLSSVMKHHQKYFPVTEKSGKDLLPIFIFVCGTPVEDESVVIKGNEKVLKARFNDAEFFYTEDLKIPLFERLNELKGMTYLSEIGTYYEKALRIEKVSYKLATLCGKDEKFKEKIKRAALLCKADLVSQMVFEFPELQGIMGKYYALHSGEDPEVAKAIEEHYMPTARDASLPKTELGALLSIADKIDNISCCFAASLKPTGSTDPFALRRQGIGTLQITLEHNLDYKLSELIESNLKEINASFNHETVLCEIIEFLAERFKNFLTEKGFSYDVIDSVITCGFENILDAFNRIKALEEFKKHNNFEELAIAFKRVTNILKKASPPNEVDTTLFQHESEKELYSIYNKISKTIDSIIYTGQSAPEKDNYIKALKLIKELKNPLDNFFDSVLVMEKDEKIRNNRLALLNKIQKLFLQIADISKIQTFNSSPQKH